MCYNLYGDNMKIDKIKKLPNNKYKIYLSNKEVITTYDDVILKNNLLFQKELDSELLNNLQIDNDYYTLYNKCINLISKKLRSEKEVRDYLDKYTTEQNDIDSIIVRLKEIGLINDLVYTKAFISDRLNLSNSGPLKIENDLIEHNIDSNIILNEMSKIDIQLLNDKINKYINKKIKTNTKYSSYILKQKILTELINLGFSKEMIIENLDNCNISSVIDKEYNKQYKRLSTKYSGQELYYQLKNKLYQKGYNNEEINEILKKVDF